MRKFQTGKNAQRFNDLIDDVSVLKSKSGRGAYNTTFGVVRCFLLTDTSAEPMIATGQKWDGSAWVQNGLGESVHLYPHPNFTNNEYNDDDYVFARNFGGIWVAVEGSGSGGWGATSGTLFYYNASFTMDGTNRYLDISGSNVPSGALVWGQLEATSTAAGNEAKVWGSLGTGGIRLVSQVASVKMYATGLARNYDNRLFYNIHSNFSGSTLALYLRYYIE